MNKKTQSINIKTTPAGAKLEIYDSDGKMIYSSDTPTIAVLKRGKGYFSAAKYRIVINMGGYQTREFIISGRVNNWYLFGNLLFGGLIGYLIVDPNTGSMWTLSPDDIDLELQQSLSSLGPQEKGLMVVLRKDISKNLSPYLKPIKN